MNKNILVGFVVMLMMLSQPFFPMAAGSAPEGGSGDSTSGTSSRATLETWTETDWSGAKVNTSQDVELELSPGEAVLSSDIGNMVELFSPTTQSGIYSMVKYNGSIFVSSSSPGTGSSEIFSCDEITVQCVKITTLTEDMVYDMSVNANGSKLYIPGAKQMNAAQDGSVYVYDGKTVKQLQVTDGITKTLGIRSAGELSGKIYAASVDNDNRAHIYRSLDNGTTWAKVPAQSLAARPYARTMNAMGVLGDTLYYQPDGLATEGPKIYSNNGSGWVSKALPGMTTDYGAFATIGGTPYFIVDGYLYAYKNGAWASVASPTSPTLQSTILYDVTTDTFKKGTNLLLPRYGHTSDLSKGKVVTAGGMVGEDIVDSTELYDVATGAVSAANPMSLARAFHRSVVTKDGLVVVTGGLSGQPPIGYSATSSVERYNVTLNQWAIANSMATARYNHTATLLKDGRILIAGGLSNPATCLASAAIYNPVSNTWTTVAPMNYQRANHTATLLQNGTVLVVGGESLVGISVVKVELYNATSNKWIILDDSPIDTKGGAASLMDNWNVMVTGPFQACVYNTVSDSWGPVISLATSRTNFTSTALPGGKVLVTGGKLPSNSFTNSAEIYTTATGAWAPSGSNLTEFVGNHKAVLLNSTTILFTGGLDPLWTNTNHITTALTFFGKTGLVTASADNIIHIKDAAGNWTQYPVTTPYPGIHLRNVMVSHGRVLVSTGSPAKVLVAASSLSGTIVSKPHSFGGYVTNATINWNALLPTWTTVKFQVRSARGLQALETAEFLGPDGTNATYFTSSNTNLGTAHKGHNVFQYKAFLLADYSMVSPILQDISIVAFVEPLALRTLLVSPPDVTITADQFAQFNVTGFDQFGTTMNIVPVWTATGGSINPVTGNYTPKFAGSWKVHATVGTLDATANVTVEPGVLKSIKIIPDKWIGTTDDTKKFEAQGLDAKGNSVVFSPNWAISGGGSISQDGNFSPTREGVWTIYCNDTATGSSGNATAMVSLGYPGSIVLDPTSAELTAGEHKQFTATVYDSDGNHVNFPVEWRTSGGGTITINGDYTGQIAGNWMIYANISQYKLSATAIVTVVPGPLASVQVIPAERNVRAGEIANFTAKPLDAFGNPISTGVEWAVSGGGEISYGEFTPSKAGVWTVYANTSGIQGIAVVHVRAGALSKIIVTPTVTNVTTNNWTMFTVQGQDKYGNAISGMSVLWTVSSELGTMDQSGGFTAGKKKGTGTVTATATYENTTIVGTAMLTVILPKKPAQEVTPAYYLPLEIAVLATLIAVGALIAVELSKKDGPNQK